VEADYYILLNSDIEVTENWIAPVIELLEQDELVAACQPKIRSFLEPKKFEYAGAAGDSSINMVIHSAGGGFFCRSKKIMASTMM